MTKQVDANYCHDVILPILMDEFIGDPDDGFEPDEERYSPTLCGWFTPEEAEPAFSGKIMEWFDSSTDREVSNLRSMLESAFPLNVAYDTLPPVIQRESAVIRDVIVNIVPDDDYREFANGLLSHRHAYMSIGGLQKEFFYFTALSCFLGLFNVNDQGEAMEPLYPADQVTAVLRYQFEASADGHLNFEGSPVHDGHVQLAYRAGRSLNERTWVMNDAGLSDLIVHNHDRVDELIRLSQERDTHDPKLLRYLLDNPTHSAVTIGTL